MTPAAHISAAIALLDRIEAGALADRALADWGRQNRYAGSGDRAAIADIVYDVLRRKRSLALLGGGAGGRALLLGYLRAAGRDPATVFGADRYAPAPLTLQELATSTDAASDDSIDADMPAWLWPQLQRSLDDKALDIAQAMRLRAPVHLRVNLARASRDEAIATLAQEGIIGVPHALSPAAVEIVEGARKIKNAQLYAGGIIELQDASSQAVADLVPLEPGQSLLDFCAGGGGKTLAVAGRVPGRFVAHDAEPRRMKDLPARAARAGVSVQQASLPQIKSMQGFDTVLVDAPCSGSGSWRRDPQGKWLLTPARLAEVVAIQRDILMQTAVFVRPRGHLVYATCSLLDVENEQQISGFLERSSGFVRVSEQRFSPLDGGDGFYCAVLRRI